MSYQQPGDLKGKPTGETTQPSTSIGKKHEGSTTIQRPPWFIPEVEKYYNPDSKKWNFPDKKTEINSHATAARLLKEHLDTERDKYSFGEYKLKTKDERYEYNRHIGKITDVLKDPASQDLYQHVFFILENFYPTQHDISSLLTGYLLLAEMPFEARVPVLEKIAKGFDPALGVAPVAVSHWLLCISEAQSPKEHPLTINQRFELQQLALSYILPEMQKEGASIDVAKALVGRLLATSDFYMAFGALWDEESFDALRNNLLENVINALRTAPDATLLKNILSVIGTLSDTSIHSRLGIKPASEMDFELDNEPKLKEFLKELIIQSEKYDIKWTDHFFVLYNHNLLRELDASFIGVMHSPWVKFDQYSAEKSEIVDEFIKAVKHKLGIQSTGAASTFNF